MVVSLFGCNVIECSHDLPGPGHLPGFGKRHGDAEIGHLGHALVIDQDVLGLQVPVQDPLGMQKLKRGTDVPQHAPSLLQRHRLLGRHPLPQITALDIFHHQVRPALDDAPVIDPHHVGMSQVGHHQRLTLEAQCLLGLHHLGQRLEYLDRDLTIERELPGEDRVAHPAKSNPTHELVPEDLGDRHRIAGLGGKRGHGRAGCTEDGSCETPREPSVAGPASYRAAARRETTPPR